MLYRDKAPVSPQAWVEMEEELRNVFVNFLSGRKVFHVDGPKGVNFNVVSEGRLSKAKEKGEVGYSTYEVQPLTEIRTEFTMSRWELDNIVRGAKDVDYDPLTEAAKKIAEFEEKAIFFGLEDGQMEGIIPSSGHETLEFGDDAQDIMDSLTEAVLLLEESYAKRPFSLIVGRDVYKSIQSETSKGYPLAKRIENLIGGNIVFNHIIDGAILVPYDHDDLEMTIGQDLALGYQSHDNNTVTFYITESFTFRILDENLIVNLKL